MTYIKSGNATQAYIDAGYSPKGAMGAACKLLQRPDVAAEVAARKAEYQRTAGIARLIANDSIAAEIAKRVEEYTRTAGITLVQILEEQKLIGFSNLAAAFDPNTGALLPIHKMPEHMQRAVASIKVTERAGGMEITGEGGTEHVPLYDKEVKLWDKAGALKILMEYFRMLPPPESQTTVNVQVNVGAALERIREINARRG